MQELVLNPSGRTLDDDVPRTAERTGARDEFEARLLECGPLAFRVARGVLRNTADAEDVAQDALLRAYRSFKDLRDPAHFRSWIVKISFRLALDRWRSKKRREARETSWSLPRNSALGSTAEEIAASRELESRLDRALDELPEKFRLVLILSAIEGHTLEEVSRLLEIPMGTVKSRLFFARKKLAEKLK
jgi:RNA polymerase sigma-70 factor (ECF subfamily)